MDRTREFRDRFSRIYVADASRSREFGASAASESGAGDEAIISIAGHVSGAMPSRYSHVRMEAKRRALDEIAARQRKADERRQEEAERRQAARRFLHS